MIKISAPRREHRATPECSARTRSRTKSGFRKFTFASVWPGDPGRSTGNSSRRVFREAARRVGRAMTASRRPRTHRNERGRLMRRFHGLIRQLMDPPWTRGPILFFRMGRETFLWIPPGLGVAPIHVTCLDNDGYEFYCPAILNIRGNNFVL